MRFPRMHPVPAQAVSADTWTRTGTVWSEDCHPPPASCLHGAGFHPNDPKGFPPPGSCPGGCLE
eukprot:6381338-Prymnesium_polylepis.1